MQWLIADIGGTHVRFATVATSPRAPLRLADVWQAPTADFADVRGALVAYRAAATSANDVAGVCLAVAGPVADGRADLTNAGWDFDARALGAQLALPVYLVNDFHAQAAALGALDEAALERIGSAIGEARRDESAQLGPRVVLGPGTGLGGAAWLPNGAGGLVVPTEIGHTEAAASDALERELLGVLAQRFGRVTWEHIFSGPGLVNLHAAMGALWGVDPTRLFELTPRDVVTAADSEPMAMHTLDVFANWLGGLAGNLALTFLARGGVFVAGSIAEQLADRLVAGGFRRRFEDAGPMTALLAAVPTARIRGLDHGLRGAAVLARQFAALG